MLPHKNFCFSKKRKFNVPSQDIDLSSSTVKTFVGFKPKLDHIGYKTSSSFQLVLSKAKLDISLSCLRINKTDSWKAALKKNYHSLKILNKSKLHKSLCFLSINGATKKLNKEPSMPEGHRQPSMPEGHRQPSMPEGHRLTSRLFGPRQASSLYLFINKWHKRKQYGLYKRKQYGLLWLVQKSIDKNILRYKSNVAVKQIIRPCLFTSIKQQLDILEVCPNSEKYSRFKFTLFGNIFLKGKVPAWGIAGKQKKTILANRTYRNTNTDKVKLTTNYLIKSLIKNCQNIPMTIVVIYLNMICRVWPVFYAWGGVPFLFKKSSFDLKQLSFLWGLRSLVGNQQNNSCLSNIVLVMSSNNTTNATIKTLILTKFLRKKKSFTFFRHLVESNKQITRLKIKSFNESSLAIPIPKQSFAQYLSISGLNYDREQICGQFSFNRESVKPFCLRLDKTINYVQKPLTDLLYSPHPPFFSLASAFTKLDNTYLTLWQLTKKKQNQNPLYAIFKKYWLIMRFNTCFIKLKKTSLWPKVSNRNKKRCEPFFKPEVLKIQDKRQCSLYLMTKKTQIVFITFLGAKYDQKKTRLTTAKLWAAIYNFKTIIYLQQSRKQLCIHCEARLKSFYLLGCEAANWSNAVNREKTDKIRFFKNSLTYKSIFNITAHNSAKKISQCLNASLFFFPPMKLDQDSFAESSNTTKQLANKKLYLQTYYF